MTLYWNRNGIILFQVLWEAEIQFSDFFSRFSIFWDRIGETIFIHTYSCRHTHKHVNNLPQMCKEFLWIKKKKYEIPNRKMDKVNAREILWRKLTNMKKASTLFLIHGNENERMNYHFAPRHWQKLRRQMNDFYVVECVEYERVWKRKVVPNLVWTSTFLHDVIHSLIPDKLLKQFSDKL